ncbi:phage antirepressor KilAC domain-containing protein [Comamonas thiooxydans]|uniref:phage antirepressor KilAC domain-containing protein n=1 Tax=Comamonas thiooxydans TaxID=363952 RepID=UPI0021139203|nr:phage antirepressor KilAC domain-containing protein [Comamonas thiooxydans]UUE94452.1 phage regulatory protein/antirepressor Ant [Comamonas thiooxydans]
MSPNSTLSPAAVPLTMSSREIADLVEARHNDVVATVLRLFSKGLLRSSRKTRREVTGGRPIDVYDLIERDTHLVVSGYSDEHRARVIDRWQALEARQVPALPNFADPVAAARAWADAKEGEQIAVAQLALAAPKVEFVERYVQPGTGSMGVREVCKVLGAKLNEFTDFLLKRGLMYRTTPKSPLTPRAEHMHNGRFEAKTGTAEHGETSHAFVHYKFTPKGVEWIAGLWGSHRARLAQEGSASA